MEQNPLSYKAIRFTTEATIKSIDPNRDWYYVSCHQCNKVAISLGENYCCLDHGPQPGPFFRYKFKGRIADSSVTAPMTFFSPAADKTTRNPCNELVEKYKPADPKKLPTEILMIQGKTTIFQFHFNTFANTTDLSLDDVFDIKTTDQGTNSAPEQMHKGTSSTSTEATQPVTDRGKIKRKKQK
nr:hypothetical protein [Tanacetum cinerariifolium]